MDLSELRPVYEGGETELLVNEGIAVGEGVSLFGTDDALAGFPDLEGFPRAPGHETVIRRRTEASAGSSRAVAATPPPVPMGRTSSQLQRKVRRAAGLAAITRPDGPVRSMAAPVLSKSSW